MTEYKVIMNGTNADGYKSIIAYIEAASPAIAKDIVYEELWHQSAETVDEIIVQTVPVTYYYDNQSFVIQRGHDRKILSYTKRINGELVASS